jgi:hypothetical protein
MLTRLIAISIPVCLALVFSLRALMKKRSLGSLVQLIGAVCLVIVVLAHMAEAFHLFPQMGWGFPNSPGHYLDLSSAIIGISLFTFGCVLRCCARQKKAY